ncbi:Major Facilitator Superfamily protein [Marvinbryantia formatexigens]|nr:Major Facilitator Superfamily protein [Marvinbryantia formatexigens]
MCARTAVITHGILYFTQREIKTMNIKKQTGLLYLYEAIICFRMVDVVWVIFLLGRGYSLAEVGIAEGIFHVTSMIFEIPSGMAADLCGRKRTLVLSGIMGMLSCIFMMLDGFRGWIYVGMIFSALSLNLASGTEEALLYDSLLEAGCAQRYGQVRSRSSVIGRISSALSCMASPVAIAAGFRYTYLGSALLDLGSALAALGMSEPQVTEEQKNRRAYTLKENRKRLIKHVQTTLIFIREHPKIMGKLFANGALGCPCFLIMMYLQEHLVNCGWPQEFIGIPMLLIPLAGALGAWLASRNKKPLFKMVILLGLLSGAGICLTGSSVLWLSLTGACIVRVCEGFAEIAVSEDVNRQFTSDQRATLVSVDSMIYSMLMVVASPVTGFLGSRYGVQAIFVVMGVILLTAVCVLGWLYRRKNKCHR